MDSRLSGERFIIESIRRALEDWDDYDEGLYEEFEDSPDPVELLLVLNGEMERISQSIFRAKKTGRSPAGDAPSPAFWDWMVRAQRALIHKRIASHRVRSLLGIDICSLRDKVYELHDLAHESKCRADSLERENAELKKVIEGAGGAANINEPKAVKGLRGRIKGLKHNAEMMKKSFKKKVQRIQEANDRDNKERRDLFAFVADLYASAEQLEVKWLKRKIFEHYPGVVPFLEKRRQVELAG